ncbi:MAG: hypothetical protein A3G87_08980 [Omnitrophica bacterium RIFCSPLOWO2_12_FULL_50_11]|nr:MAG: hypothetical protein A3G87_08980 [Omnitrophica bacterium RIFCSPLOWO2_12_FULL_50_11]
MMKRVMCLFLIASLPFLVLLPSQVFSEGAYETTGAGPAVDTALGSELIIADFDTGDKPNNIGGDFGTWDKDPNDETQVSQMSFEAEDALGDELGYSIRLDYDVDSPNPAYNGFWMKLQNFDASAYNTVNFYVRGDETNGFTKRLKIELKDSTNQPSPFIITGLTDEWQKFSIPFEKFRRVKFWDALNEFVLVFDDINSNPKTGTIYLDQVTFSSE